MSEAIEGWGRAGLGGSPSLAPHLGKHPNNPQLGESPEKGRHAVFIRDLEAVPSHLGQMSTFKLREGGRQVCRQQTLLPLNLPTCSVGGTRSLGPLLP